MGDVTGNPTDKECEGALRPESFKQLSTNRDIVFSSTGLINSKEPTSGDSSYDYYANRVTTWCVNYGEWGKYLAP